MHIVDEYSRQVCVFYVPESIVAHLRDPKEFVLLLHNSYQDHTLTNFSDGGWDFRKGQRVYVVEAGSVGCGGTDRAWARELIEQTCDRIVAAAELNDLLARLRPLEGDDV
jgi:hypothetical protein